SEPVPFSTSLSISPHFFRRTAMKRCMGVALVVAFVGLAGVARGADKADPNGTWKWKFTVNGQDRDVTLKLKLDGDKLTGKISGRNNTETDIEEASFKDNEVSFSVTRERDGKTESRDWEAKREKTT